MYWWKQCCFVAVKTRLILRSFGCLEETDNVGPWLKMNLVRWCPRKTSLPLHWRAGPWCENAWRVQEGGCHGRHPPADSPKQVLKALRDRALIVKLRWRATPVPPCHGDVFIFSYWYDRAGRNCCRGSANVFYLETIEPHHFSDSDVIHTALKPSLYHIQKHRSAKTYINSYHLGLRATA